MCWRIWMIAYKYTVYSFNLYIHAKLRTHIYIYIYTWYYIYMVIPWTYGRTSQHHRFSSFSQLGCWTETLWVSGFYCLGGLWQKHIYPQQITCESRKVNDIGTVCPPQFSIITLATVTIADLVTSSINQSVELRVNLISFGCPTLQVWNWVRCKTVMVYTTLHWCYIATEGKYCVVISMFVDQILVHLLLVLVQKSKTLLASCQAYHFVHVIPTLICCFQHTRYVWGGNCGAIKR